MAKLDDILERDNLTDFEIFFNQNKSRDLDYIFIRVANYDNLPMFKFLIEKENILDKLNKNALTTSIIQNGALCFNGCDYHIRKWCLKHDTLKNKIDILKGNLSIFSNIGYQGDFKSLELILDNNYPRLTGKTEEAALFNTISSCCANAYYQDSKLEKNNLISVILKFLQPYFEKKYNLEKLDSFFEDEKYSFIKLNYENLKCSFLEKELLEKNTSLVDKKKNLKI